MIKVVTSCCGRFHIFDQAAQLENLGYLYRLIHSDPKFLSKRWGLPNSKVISFLLVGILARLLRHIPENMRKFYTPYVHIYFGKKLSKAIPKDSSVFIGLSSFSLEAIDKCKGLGILTIVDHGSLHPEYERDLIADEEKILGLQPGRFIASEKLITRQKNEFLNADYIFVLSEAAKKSLINKGVPPGKVFVNSCGVDLSSFYKKEGSDSPFRIIFCGSITPRKGLHYLLQAFQELKLPAAEVWIVGTSNDLEYIRYLKKNYTSASIKYKGSFSQSQLVHVYNECSVFVLPSISDGFGMVVSQAQACGLPVITTENVGAADIIKDGVNGFIIPIREIETLKNRIKVLYYDRKFLMKMSEAALIYSKNNFGWDNYGKRLAQFLDEHIAEQFHTTRKFIP
jgi:glycosyltransferase involved in cell wall biosynthesis